VISKIILHDLALEGISLKEINFWICQADSNFLVYGSGLVHGTFTPSFLFYTLRIQKLYLLNIIVKFSTGKKA
jgi:hypothetical protein